MTTLIKKNLMKNLGSNFAPTSYKSGFSSLVYCAKTKKPVGDIVKVSFPPSPAATVTLESHRKLLITRRRSFCCTSRLQAERNGRQGMTNCQRQALRIGMEILPEKKDKVYSHYNHTDACKLARWNARECYEFMYARPWHRVNDFYADMVNGCESLSALLRKERSTRVDFETVESYNKSEVKSDPAAEKTGRWARLTFKIHLSYHGGSFDGWQKQPGLNTVQGIVEKSLGKFVDEKKAELLKEKKLPLEYCCVVAGRTDKGVTAFQQVCSFNTWRKDIRPQEVKEAINEAVPGKIRVISVDEVSRDFHPNFSAKWRRYLYIFPLDNEEGIDFLSEKDTNDETNPRVSYTNDEFNESKHNDDMDQLEFGSKPAGFDVSKVNKLLQQLEGKLLSYKMFARDTKASRNTGPPTECFFFHARATEALLPCKQGESSKVMCIELVANRFLRKMVRVLVATAIREAAAGADDDSLLKLMDATCRRATAPPAPPDGLCLVDVGYTTDFNHTDYFIS